MFYKKNEKKNTNRLSNINYYFSTIYIVSAKSRSSVEIQNYEIIGPNRTKEINYVEINTFLKNIRGYNMTKKESKCKQVTVI